MQVTKLMVSGGMKQSFGFNKNRCKLSDFYTVSQSITKKED